ncbi:DNA helicase PcrA [Pengzhenrongella phosphoraccumulans]|uniref:DNA helicase PcrA n=1 Tax=Pengzhenrongella phosphoraccumulans TaxID=3114394 RepID=UPI00388FF201
MNSLFANLPLPGLSRSELGASASAAAALAAAAVAPHTVVPSAVVSNTGVANAVVPDGDRDVPARGRKAASGTPSDSTASDSSESDTSPAAAPSVRDPESLLVGLNPQQREAVLHSGGPLLIVAGAGSGKTRVLTHRIAYLLATRRARASEILAITFTNKAAAEMRERVETLVGPPARSMWVSTFHSACVRILRKEHKTLGLRSSFSIYDSADSLKLMSMVARELDLDAKRYPPKVLISKISALKDELIDPETFARSSGSSEDAANEFDAVLGQAYARYQVRLQQAHALDFDDLIMTTVHLLQAFPAVAEHYRRRFRHVLVDEYQDTNHAQYMLVRELAGITALVGGKVDAGEVDAAAQFPPGELTVVGDADQSIYAFRGATIRNIVEFEADYPNARTILLEQNYRSTQNILSAANAVISRNTGRKRKRLWTDSGAGPAIVGYVADNEHEEARFVAEEIDRLGDSDGVRPGDVAVFYRANAQSRALEEVLIRVGLPYKVVGGTRFYERREVKDAVAYLRAIANPDDDVNLRRILNVPKRGLGDRSEAMVQAFAERERISFGAGLDRIDEVPGLAARAVTGLRAFATMMSELRALAATGAGPAEVLGAVLDRTGYLAELRASEDPQDAARVENLSELHAVASEFEVSEPDGDLADFLERVSLVADSDQIPSDDDGDGAPKVDQGVVTLMTLHTAKGLEFPVVFLTGLEDGTFPHIRSLADDAQLAEERRLAYVGLTRARERLYVSRAAVRTSWGMPNEFPASRFLDDLPEELVDWRRRESSMAVLRSGAGYGSGYGGSAPKKRPVPPSPDAPKFGSATPRPAGDVPSLAIGDRVTHDSYGLGTVVGVEGAGPNCVAKIDFGSDGTKRLLLRYSPVTKL